MLRGIRRFGDNCRRTVPLTPVPCRETWPCWVWPSPQCSSAIWGGGAQVADGCRSCHLGEVPRARCSVLQTVSPARRRPWSLFTWSSPWAVGVSIRPGGWFPLEQVTGEGRADVSGARDLEATRTGPALRFSTPASTAAWGARTVLRVRGWGDRQLVLALRSVTGSESSPREAAAFGWHGNILLGCGRFSLP